MKHGIEVYTIYRSRIVLESCSYRNCNRPNSCWWPQLVCFRVLVGRHQEHHAANQYGLTTKEYWLNKKLKAVVLGHLRLKNSKIFLAISGKNLKLGS